MFKSLLQPKIETNTTAELTAEGEIKQLRVEVRNGSIRVQQWEQPHLQANVHVLASGSYAEELQQSGTEACWSFQQKGNEAVFEQQQPHSFLQSIRSGGVVVNVELFVPHDLHAKLESHNGRIVVEQYRGNVRAVTHNGEMEMREVEGHLELEGHNGRMEVEDVDGDLEVTTHNGNIQIATVTGRVTAETHNGKIKARDCRQQLRLLSRHGDIKVQLAEPLTASWEIETKHGTIEADIPRDTKAALDLQTKIGKISGNALPVAASGMNQQLKINLGEAGPTIRLTSKIGNIELNTSK